VNDKKEKIEREGYPSLRLETEATLYGTLWKGASTTVYNERLCPYGNKCKFTHVNRFSQPSDENATIIYKFVDSDKYIAFSPYVRALCPPGS